MTISPGAIAAGLASIGRGLASFVPSARTGTLPPAPTFPRCDRADDEALRDDWRGLGWGSRDWTELGDWRDVGRRRRRPRKG